MFGNRGNSSATIKHIKNRNLYCVELINHYDKSRYFNSMDYDIIIEDINNIV
jgi:hypothetical protein